MSTVAPSRVWIPAVLGVCVVAVILRGIAVTDGFWFDEVWSWWNLDQITTWSDVFLKLQHDNNHQLITLWMYVLGDQDNWIWYRLPSFLAGLITVLLVMDRTRGAWGIVIPGGVFAVSSLMLLYGTEARGYAMAVCFCLAGFRLLERREGEGFRLPALETAAYWVLVVLAFSAHFISLHFFVAAILWTSVALVRTETIAMAVTRSVRLHLVPGGYVLWLWFTVVRDMEIGGGTHEPAFVIAHQLLTWMTGAPPSMSWAVIGAVILVGFAVLECFGRAREGSRQWVFLVAAAFLTPFGVLALANQSEILYPRYFLIAVATVLLFASRGMVRAHARGGFVALGSLVVAGLCVAGNLVRDVDFLRGGGRGQYRAAIEYIAARSPEEIWIGADFDSRVFPLVEYYRRFLRKGQVLKFIGDAPRRKQGPPWFLEHDPWYRESPFSRRGHPASRRLAGGLYEKDREYRSYGLSGFSWILYRRVQ